VLGERVIEMRDPADTCAVAAGLVGLGEGNLSGIDELRDVLKKADYARTEHVLAAIEPCAASMR
jgi:hypothetical protein